MMAFASLFLRRQMIRQIPRCRQLMSTTPSNSSNEIYTPIVIVGAGPSGLFLSRLLDSYQTPCIVLEACPSLTSHPQAHFLNTRTMEILRHSLPIIHKRIREEMPPVEEWKRFRFGHDMNHALAQVIHPVDRPLQANVDANGMLLSNDDESLNVSSTMTRPLSPCSVGHLAQHSFCKILSEAPAPCATVYYGKPVINVQYNQDKSLHRVITSDGSVFVAPVVVAADGFHSTVRKLWDIPMDGQEGIQQLINIHIRVHDKEMDVPPAMLYAIWNSRLVGMMVRHSSQEYVLQIPYFPPYQTMERNFTPPQVQTMVEAAFGTTHGISIQSIRPWTMSSLIARRYISNDHTGGVLVGDAAHVFPPAGGFGMNTGLQDAHNLAWRLATWHKNGQPVEQLESLLSRYESERRPIAQRNAALSVRNYHRILELSKACYLNEQHPSLLVRFLDQMTLLPLSTRQTMFQSLLETATFPLSALQNPNNPHAKLVARNVRTILKQGRGLPLLFPDFELGFGYGGGEELCEEEQEQKHEDSMGFTPQIKVGHLLPHVELQVMHSSKHQDYSNLSIINEKDSSCDGVCISSTDLPAQLQTDNPCFVLLFLNTLEHEPPQLVCHALDTVKTECRVSVASVEVVCTDKQPTTILSSFDLVVKDVEANLSDMIDTDGPVVIVLRPDGHIARVIPMADFQKPEITNIITASIEQTL